ncbi:GFA family protein [Novosphingobium sp. B 225]|uniref:GFA family protein n=1 Tax=Novosphingobium sp. B 225 TaxID=1961849 RepID=UPI001595C780|nr:GFA family protein [Novosphingobium sp. B 225]
MREGGCRCGAVRFSLSGQPLGGIACHCRDCQYVAGGSANLSWIFAYENLSLTKGQPRSFRAKKTSGGTLFCGHCGVQLFSRPDSNQSLVAVKIGALDDASGFKVDADLWMSSATDWHQAHQGAVQYAGNMIDPPHSPGAPT